MEQFDTVIVGAGLSGLSAADTLSRAGQRVCVIEARERVGGRSWTVQASNGLPVDIGGQWVGPTQRRVLGLIHRLGLKTYPQFTDGRKHQQINGVMRRYRGTIPALPAFALADLQLRIWQLEAAARRLPADAPWTADDAEQWDQLSVAQWLQDRVWSRDARSLIRIATHAVFAMEPERISMLQFLAYLRSAGGLMPLLEARGGAQDSRIAGGAQQLSERLAEDLVARGGQLRLGEPVSVIDQDPERALIVTPDREMTAARVIVALSPADQARIELGTGTSTARRQLCHDMPMGSVIKCIALYERPFWRDQGNSGEYVGDQEPLRMSFDGSPPDRRCGALVGFILGKSVARWSRAGQAARREAVCQQLAGIFGAEASQPIDYIDQDWSSEEWTGGCYVGLFGPGRMQRHAALLRRAEGRLHWAGTETARQWNGYLDGAIEAGERAATEVLACHRDASGPTPGSGRHARAIARPD